MALFDQQKPNPQSQAMALRNQGLPDSVVADEMQGQGYPPGQVQSALGGQPPMPSPSMAPSFAAPSMPAPQDDDALYSRIEEITENLIDEKWDELIGEVKRIIQWKEKIEEIQTKLVHDIEKLTDNFKTLHQGVLGKLEAYDGRMRDVGTELGAVSKVFKDVVPEFVDNVKELSSLTKHMKR